MSSENSSCRYHHGDLQNALLEAAGRVLVEKGADGLSLRAVARAAGVSHAAPYRHFRDKATLLRELARAGFRQLAQAIASAAQDKPSGPEQKLIEACVAYVSLAVQQPEMTRVMFAGSSGLPDGSAQTEAAAAAYAALLVIVEEGIGLGSFRQRPPRELAMVAWASMHGLAMLMLSGVIELESRDRLMLDEQVRAVARNVIYGIVK